MKQKELDAEVADVVDALAALDPWAVVTDADAKEAREYARAARARWRELDEHRKHLKEPSLEAGRRVDAFFRPALDHYARLEATCKGKLAAFLAGQRDEQSAAMAAVAAGAEPMALPVVERLDGVTSKVRWVPRVVDGDAVPREYCSPDIAKLKAAAWYADTETPPRPVPGIAWEREDQVRVR